ncbi:MAG: hypothetical protein LBV79_11440 [Candidatus Adiutrix sp.]|nr:hypothetical protein [Candidatus Adiutrix sp.]
MKKHVIKFSILAIWVALMGWWWLESRSWPVPEKIEAAFLPDFTDNFGLYFGEQKVGWVYKSLRRQPGGEYQAMQGTTVELLIGGRRLEVNSTVMVNLAPSLALMDFRYLIQAGGVAVVETGQAAGNFLSVSVNLGEYAPLMEALAKEFGPMLGERAKYLDFGKEAVTPAPEGPALAAAFPPFLSHLGLAAGRNYALDTLDPFTRTLVSTSLRVEEESREYDPESGREEPVFKVRGGAAGQETFLWIDRYGRTLREEGLGFSMTRAYDLAEARRDIVPLAPPPAFQRLLKGRNVEELLKTVESLRVERDQP